MTIDAVEFPEDDGCAKVVVAFASGQFAPMLRAA